ncbi:MAG: preprotein translocase subunit Tim44 [Proteobacteria bacterium]|nr:MAG: preprotein translocase subunit Tim44 [Pseudomonadota bacterium]
MKKLLTFSMLALFCLFVSGVDHAEAKRFGMGSSFGKSFNKRSVAPAPRMSQQKKASPGKQAATAPARGGMMGMLGGLALGGLLGAMFFGGAFEGINFFDIFMIGAIIFGFIWFMRRKAQGVTQQHAYAGQQPEEQPTQPDLFTSSESTPQTSAHMLRPDIDEAHFIPAAKDIFIRMQTAWDKKDIQDIRSFCTPEIADKIESDIQSLGKAQTRTDVAMLEASMVDSWIESDDEWVAIQFHAMLKEETLDNNAQSIESQAHEMHETWIFRHNPNADDPTWYLAGIQQAES